MCMVREAIKTVKKEQSTVVVQRRLTQVIKSVWECLAERRRRVQPMVEVPITDTMIDRRMINEKTLAISNSTYR